MLFFGKLKRCDQLVPSSQQHKAESQGLSRLDGENFSGPAQQGTFSDPALQASDLTNQHHLQLALHVTSASAPICLVSFCALIVFLSNVPPHFSRLSFLPFYYVQPKTVCLSVHGSFHFLSHFFCCWPWPGSVLEFL